MAQAVPGTSGNFSGISLLPWCSQPRSKVLLQFVFLPCVESVDSLNVRQDFRQSVEMFSTICRAYANWLLANLLWLLTAIDQLRRRSIVASLEILRCIKQRNAGLPGCHGRQTSF